MKISSNIRKEVLKLAHKTMKVTEYRYEWANILKSAWKAIKEKIAAVEALKEDLKAGTVQFTFKKKDGSIREAFGTLNTNFFTYKSKGSSRKPNPEYIVYYDLDKLSFRSFHFTQFLTFSPVESKAA